MTINSDLAEQLNAILKCPGCACLFFCKSDLSAHMKAFGTGDHVEQLQRFHRQIDYGLEDAEFTGSWMKGSYGDEICPADSNPELARLCKIKGKSSNGLYEFTLSQNGKWIKRKHI